MALPGACSKEDPPPQPVGPVAAPVPEVLRNAPDDWTQFQAWAAAKLAEFPPPVPPPADPKLPAPQWPIVRLDDRFDRATVQCAWQAGGIAAEPLVLLGPFRSDSPQPDFKVTRQRQEGEAGLLMSIGGFRVDCEQVGAVSIELRQPLGGHFELRWSRGGRIRVPVPTNDRFWTFNIATDGFAEWTGALAAIQLWADGTSAQPVEIRSVKFLTKEGSFPKAAGVRRVAMDRETRNAVYLHCPGQVRFPAVDLPPQAMLRFGAGLVAAPEAESTNPPETLTLEVLIEQNGEQTSVWKQPTTQQPGWSDHGVPLDAWGGQAASVVFKVSGEPTDTVACWGNPVVYQPVADAPRVIIYLIDTVAAGHVGLYGYSRPTMPRLSALAERGVWFANAFADSPRTVESVADLLLSLPTEAHGVFHASSRAPDPLVTLPEALRAAGFATAAFVTNVNAGPRQNIDQGFEYFVDRITYWWSPGDPDRTLPIEDVVAWLNRHRDRPAFIYIHTSEPHAPYTPPEGFAGRFDPDYRGEATGYFDYDNDTGFPNVKTRRDYEHVIALYDEEIAYADARFGLFLDALAQAGLLDGTHIFVTADHGEEFLEHGSWEHGNDLHNELINIPLVAAGPRFPARGREATPAQLYDLMPTILDMFDVPFPYPLAGASLLPCLTGSAQGAEADGLARRVIVASNHSYRSSGVTQYAAIEGGRWKLMHQAPARKSTGRRFEVFSLFDRQADPLEQTDVLQAHPDIARRLIGQLVEWHLRYRPIETRAAGDQLMLDAEQLEELRSLGYIN